MGLYGRQRIETGNGRSMACALSESIRVNET
jgi:hypothetical protein